MRAYCDDLFAKAVAAGHGSYGINGWHCHCAGLYDLSTEPRILDPVQDLLGEDLVLWGTHFFLKEPGDSKRVSWHQDASYWPLSPSKTVTVWLAIDDADAGNGAMQVIPRSHVNAQLAYKRSSAEENNVLSQTTLDAEEKGRSSGDDRAARRAGVAAHRLADPRLGAEPLVTPALRADPAFHRRRRARPEPGLGNAERDLPRPRLLRPLGRHPAPGGRAHSPTAP